jgi:hypothetical protein
MTERCACGGLAPGAPPCYERALDATTSRGGPAMIEIIATIDR